MFECILRRALPALLASLAMSGALLAVQVQPETRGISVSPPLLQETRVALVIGNGAYKSAPLRNPVNDAVAMAKALRGCGFQVTLLENATRERMFTALRGFGNALQGGGVGLFYFAGHGIQVKGRNFLVPVDADLASEDEAAYTTLDVDSVLAKMDTARNQMNIVILDACRNNPFGRSFRSAQQGLAQMDAPAGTYIAFATAPGHTAVDGTGSHGLFTDHLLAQMATPGLKVEDVFKRVRAGVMKKSNGLQVPWESSSITGDFFFIPAANGTSPLPNLAPAKEEPPPVPLFTANQVKKDRRFIAYDDLTVLDTSTHLLWAARDNGFDIDWAKAKAYCENCRIGGYTDWRMPTADELAGLYDANNPHPASCNRSANISVTTDLIEITCFWVWTSETRTSFLGNNTGAFSFGKGMKLWLRQSEGLLRRALPVRSVREPAGEKPDRKSEKGPRSQRTSVPSGTGH